MVENNIRFCGECGAQLRSGATFCGECGRPATLGPRDAESPKESSFSTGRPTAAFKRLIPKLVLAAAVLAVPIGGFAFYQDMREKHGADFNFDGYITPKEVMDYASDHSRGWGASGTWQFRPLTMYGSSEMRHVAERLNTTKDADYPFMSQIYSSLQLGDQDILPNRMDQCLITRYNVRRSRAGGASLDGITGPYNQLEVELDCSSHAAKGKSLSARLIITHNDRCMKGFIDYDDNTGNVTASSYIKGEFIGYKDDSCLGDENFAKSNIYYPQAVWLGFELTRGFAVIEENFFIINRHLNAESEDRRRKDEAAARQAEATQKAALEANCAAGTAPDEDCAALEDARRDAAAAASGAAAAAADAAAAAGEAGEMAAKRAEGAGASPRADAKADAEAAAKAAAARM